MEKTYKFIPVDQIEGVVCQKLTLYRDQRGCLMEFFRHDELENLHHPVMGYVSVTLPGTTRGPHEHQKQTDVFCFAGPGDFQLVLWDNRVSSSTYCGRLLFTAGEGNPLRIIVPSGVAHAYRCVSKIPGTVINIPNQLYRGTGRASAVDEIRHEDDPQSPFVMDLKTIA